MYLDLGLDLVKIYELRARALAFTGIIPEISSPSIRPREY